MSDDERASMPKVSQNNRGLTWHLVFLKRGDVYVCQCRTRTKDHSWRKETVEI